MKEVLEINISIDRGQYPPKTVFPPLKSFWILPTK